jgi:hypothetical protein
MALIILGKTTCSICDEPLMDGEDLVSTTHFIGDRADPLWRFSDSAMHSNCFSTWSHRAEFVERYNATVGQMVWGNNTRHRMKPDGTIVSENVADNP